MNWLEIAAAGLGVANIVLLVRRSIWNYAFGLAMVALYVPVFVEARLYSDALLQVFFFAVQIYGWRAWRRNEADTGEVRVERLGWRARAGWLAAALVATAAWGAAMARLTDAAFPYLDGANAMFSITAQILLARRLIENWVVWIAVDVLAIGLYVARGLAATACLYVIMLALCIWGLKEWNDAAGRWRASPHPA